MKRRKVNKQITMLDILSFEASTKEKDKELQKQWNKTIKELCDFIHERLDKWNYD